MDLMAIAGMLFVLIIIAMVAGFVLLLPVSRRLGAYLERRLSDGRAGDGTPSAEVLELRELVLSLQAQVEDLSERQEFTDRLLAGASESAGDAATLSSSRG